MVTIIHANNLGASTYTVQFSEPVTVVGTGDDEPAIILGDGTGDWAFATGITQLSSDTIQILDSAAVSTDTLILVVGQPASMTAAHAWQVCSPLSAIT